MSEAQIQIRLAGPSPTVGEKPRINVLEDELTSRKLEDDLRVWRYLSLGKFISLLTSSSLWFSRLDRLGDPFEGAAPKSDLVNRKGSDLERVWAAWRRWLVVSCWHAGPVESDAMWKIYAPAGEGIAIQSSIGALKKTIGESTNQYGDSDPENPKPLAVAYFGHVYYVDHGRTELDDQTPVGRYFLKRLPFAHEREIRIIAPLPEVISESGVDSHAEPDIGGVSVVVDVKTLIQEVVICPTSPKWLISAVQGLVKTYAVDCPLRMSNLAGNPQF